MNIISLDGLEIAVARSHTYVKKLLDYYININDYSKNE